MNKLMFFAALTLLNLNSAFATGIAMRSTCTPVLTEEGQVTIVFRTMTMSAPGGPATTTGSISVGGKEYKLEKKGNYEQGVTVKSVPLKYPSGSISSSLRFISVQPGKASLEPVKEVLYNCISQPGH